MAQQGKALPDFTPVARHLEEASDEMAVQLERMNQLPAITLNQITTQLTQIIQSLARVENQIRFQ